MKKKIVILGGGISGLTVAYRMDQLRQKNNLPFEITLLEASDRLGGIIQTQQREGFLIEAGPDAFITEKPWALDLCKELGLESEIIPTNENFRRSFMYSKGRLVPIPSGFYLLASPSFETILSLPFLSWPGRFRMAIEPLIPASKNSADESLASFVRRRFGTETLERIAQPLVGGIYTADPEKLSMQATLTPFLEMEKRQGSVLKGLQSRAKNEEGKASGPRYNLFVSLQKGMESLIHAVSKKISGVQIQLKTPALKIRPLSGDRWEIETANFRIEADGLCVALPAYQFAKLVENFAPDLTEQLTAIEYESAATVNVAFNRADVSHALDGFGYVVPQLENRKIIGCTFSSIKFAGRAPDGKVLLRAFLGGALQKDTIQSKDSEIEKIVLDELRETLGIKGAPLFTSIQRYAQAMPQYHVGHLDRMICLELRVKNYKGFYFCGNAYRGVGIPDSVREAEKTAVDIMDELTGKAS